MKRNPVQFQKGLSLATFLRQYGTEAQCTEAFFRWRWPSGFVCPECGHAPRYCEIRTRMLFQCKIKSQ